MVNSLDWYGSKIEILVTRVMGNVHDKVIILLHDHNNKSNAVEALPQIIKTLEKSGYDLLP
ncbi:polysaccharide deacetylase family protein [Wolbachia endosymbiont of Litomosoides sigmodontis]|uniref:hypothetical protein n=1 Tax=Wolbachia endosymbiont of Litomosoides sigmodontis TaxID=80850 RepID=UPI001FE83362|nr:hypothetical protein [Wolbachia endosymbiont of Litomosoides sigmodontis]